MLYKYINISIIEIFITCCFLSIIRMSRIIQFTIFFSIFLSIYYMLNFYVLNRFTSLFGLKRNLIFHLVVIIAAVSYILASVLIRNMTNLFTKVLYVIASVYMGILFIAFSVFIIYEIIRLFTPVPYTHMILSGIIFILSVIALVNAQTVSVKHIDIPLGKNLTLAQWSDVHVGTINNKPFLDHLVEKTNNLNPDILVITGDLVDGSAKLSPHMFDPLKNLAMPVYFITGNHETYEGIDDVLDTLKGTNVIPLRDKSVTVKGIELIGMDFSSDLSVIPTSKTKLPKVLLYHHPKHVERVKDIDLMLTGHTHNGQIVPFNLFVRLEFRYLKGLYDVHGMKLYVSPGTGTWGPPMRLGSRNEITLFNLS